jgi:hypothetical protein
VLDQVYAAFIVLADREKEVSDEMLRELVVRSAGTYQVMIEPVPLGRMAR